MSKLSSIEDTNNLLSALNIQPTEKIISVSENGLSDANFILTNLMQKILMDNGNICLVIMHNTVGHYHNVLKRLGHDIMQKIHIGAVQTIEPLKTIFSDIGNTDNRFLSTDKESIVKHLFYEIYEKINQSLKASEEKVYLIIDDVSHLLDLGISNKYIVSFLNYCVNLTSNSRVFAIINCHVVDSTDETISNCLQHCADVNIKVSPLKTGFSSDVTGVIAINRRNSTELSMQSNTFHYKALDRGIKVFAPGDSIYHLYK